MNNTKAMKYLILTAAMLSSPQALAWDTPAKAISEFLNYELGGGRLSGSNWDEYVSKYIAAPAGYDESGWDVTTIVDGFRILSVECSLPSRCKATVEFKLFPTAGLQGLPVEPHEAGGKELKTYQIVRKRKSWLLEPGFGIPIISIQTYKKYSSR